MRVHTKKRKLMYTRTRSCKRKWKQPRYMLPLYIKCTVLQDVVICDLSEDHVHVNCWHALVLLGGVLKVVLIKTI